MRAMNDRERGGGRSYFDVSDELGEAWQGASDEARRASSDGEPDKNDGGFNDLYTAFIDEARERKPLDEIARSEQFREALRAAHRRAVKLAEVAPAASLSDAQLEQLCKALIKSVQHFGYKRFLREDWQGLKSWQEVLKEESKSLDLRHVLNAAWAERVRSAVDDDQKLTAELIERAKKFLLQGARH